MLHECTGWANRIAYFVGSLMPPAPSKAKMSASAALFAWGMPRLQDGWMSTSARADGTTRTLLACIVVRYFVAKAARQPETV